MSRLAERAARLLCASMVVSSLLASDARAVESSEDVSTPTPGKRSVEYPPNGKAIRVTAADVAAAWYSTRIPALFATETARHESGYAINEVDTEPSGFVSKGIFQLTDGQHAAWYNDHSNEAKKAGFAGANLLTLEDSTRVFVTLMESNLDALIAALGHEPVGQEQQDIWAYLFISHNQGLTAALRTIKKYGVDWQAYKDRNSPATLDNYDKTVKYGDDVSGAGNLVTATVSDSVDFVADKVGVSETLDELDLSDTEKSILGLVTLVSLGGLLYYVFT